MLETAGPDLPGRDGQAQAGVGGELAGQVLEGFAQDQVDFAGSLGQDFGAGLGGEGAAQVGFAGYGFYALRVVGLKGGGVLLFEQN